LAQAYIWQGPEPSQHLPPQITVPFLTAADHLEVQPVATYAALNLWNWRPVKDSACSGRGLDSKNFNICDPDELVALHTATGTDDESWFFVISNSMEAHAGPLIRTLLAAMEAVEVDDTETIISSLEYFCRTMVSIGRLLERMDERCNPQVFYHKIRPFLAGSMNMEAAGLPDGVFYDEGDGKGRWRKYRGGSNGQSSLFQFFDAVLSVDHNRSGGFHEEMRRYMPGPHARFLNDIESIANIRSYVNQHPEDIGLVEAFNRAVAGLSDVRDKHIALVTRYIIVPSRQKKPTAQLGMNGLYRRDLASTSSQLASQKPQTQELVGTGGTKLIPFLRTSRDETNETAIIK
jgi:indoleamine 2,3-dioxygenase